MSITHTKQDHPLHPPIMLIAVLFYAITPIAFLTAYLVESQFFFRIGFVSSIIGLFAALIVTLPGFVDLAGTSEKSQEAGREASLGTILMHMVLSVAAVVVFMANIVFALPDWKNEMPHTLLPFFITATGLALKLGAFYFGGRISRALVRGVELPLKGDRAPNVGMPRYIHPAH